MSVNEPKSVVTQGESSYLSRLPVGDWRNRQIGTVTELLDKAAVFSIFSVPDKSRSNTPLYMPRVSNSPRDIIGIKVHENLHRFDIEGYSPSHLGLRSSNTVGEHVANVSIQWRLIPDDFFARPDREPPPTPLDPQRSQRFAMMDGQFTFDATGSTGFRGFGTGRTFPVNIGGERRLRIGAVVDILEGFGELEGFEGNVVVNGYIRPPNELALGMLVRLVDPRGHFLSNAPISAPVQIPDPDPSSTFLVLKGESDPTRPVTFHRENGKIVGSHLHERLRLIRTAFDIPTRRICAELRVGPIVGTLSTTTYFDPLIKISPGPLFTRGGVFTFFDANRRVFATLKADIAEGRVFRSHVDGAPTGILRICGFGPFSSGTGQFQNVDGMLSMNSAISISPLTMSMIYVLRIIDPSHRFRHTCHASWQERETARLAADTVDIGTTLQKLHGACAGQRGVTFDESATG